MQIKSIKAREVLDSRGNPTVEVELAVEKGIVRAIVPSGTSTGKYEAVELRDSNKRYHGKGVLKAVKNVSKIASKIVGRDCTKQRHIDEKILELDNTDNKHKLGANAILGVSMAVCRAGAVAKNIPLYEHIREISETKKTKIPVPCFNVINGGAHAGNNLNFQEYMIVPNTGSFKEALRYSSEIYHHLKKIIKSRYGKNAVNVGDEGGFAPLIDSIEEPLILLQQAIEKAGYKSKIKIALDVAASEFFKNNKYELEGKKLNRDELIKIYKKLIENYDIISIEDPFDQNDWNSFSILTSSVDCQVVGDDLLVTNPRRIQKAVREKACNCLLLKVNQIGTISEAIDAARLAKSNKWKIMVSHRSGETEDSFISDLAVGLNADFIKSGAPARGERTCKYNQLLRIEEEIN
ncbi:phosphopyruvate hydratase [Candidatus Pacearchaeota archaeon]|nr:phosphopyruvate hydratase [Candidatus Pacearchaeota archaeon]MBD3283201.1 phosphopyruvate hydratase [Candidatus Pacearchaeota archaeon]